MGATLPPLKIRGKGGVKRILKVAYRGEREIRTRGEWLSFDLRGSGTLEGRPSRPQPSSGTEG